MAKQDSKKLKYKLVLKKENCFCFVFVFRNTTFRVCWDDKKMF